MCSLKSAILFLNKGFRDFTLRLWLGEVWLLTYRWFGKNSVILHHMKMLLLPVVPTWTLSVAHSTPSLFSICFIFFCCKEDWNVECFLCCYTLTLTHDSELYSSLLVKKLWWSEMGVILCSWDPCMQQGQCLGGPELSSTSVGRNWSLDGSPEWNCVLAFFPQRQKKDVVYPAQAFL